MKWRNDIEVILENTNPKLELSGSVKEEIYNQLEYHFFFFTDISLNQSKGKIYFSKKRGTKQTEIVLDEGVIRVRLFASCAHDIARLGECKGKESCLVVRRRGSRFALKVQ